MRTLLVWILRIYRAGLSPVLGPCCRFHPSCSSYWMDAIGKYGCLKGVWLGARRLARCHPFHPGGLDPVP